MFQHTAARRRLPEKTRRCGLTWAVSTHSRSKAAAARLPTLTGTPKRFNTQPLEGGCRWSMNKMLKDAGFNTQPRGGGCPRFWLEPNATRGFNTQPRGGGCPPRPSTSAVSFSVSTHSRAEAAASRANSGGAGIKSFNTQPRGGGCPKGFKVNVWSVCFNTQPRGGGCV